MIEELDDLTLVYMYGAKNGRDSMKDEIERLRAALNDVAQFIPHGLWHFVKSDTLTLLREGKAND